MGLEEDRLRSDWRKMRAFGIGALDGILLTLLLSAMVITLTLTLTLTPMNV